MWDFIRPNQCLFDWLPQHGWEISRAEEANQKDTGPNITFGLKFSTFDLILGVYRLFTIFKNMRFSTDTQFLEISWIWIKTQFQKVQIWNLDEKWRFVLKKKIWEFSVARRCCSRQSGGFLGQLQLESSDFLENSQKFGGLNKKNLVTLILKI